MEQASGSKAWGSAEADPSNQPAGSRRAAEEQSPEASNQRRARWRESLSEEIWREHMPVGFEAAPSQRTAFSAALEAALLAFIRDGRAASDEAAGAHEKGIPDGEAEEPGDGGRPAVGRREGAQEPDVPSLTRLQAEVDGRFREQGHVPGDGGRGWGHKVILTL